MVAATGADDVNVDGRDVAADGGGRACKRANLGRVLGRRGALEVAKDNVGNGQRAGVLGAQRQVALAVALGDFNGIVDIVNEHAVKGDIVDTAVAAAALQVARERRGRVGPDFNAPAVGGAVHANVADPDILDNVVLADILAQAADRNTVAARARQGLDEHVGAVGLEGDAVVAVVDDRVHNGDVAAAVGIPAVGVFGNVGTRRCSRNRNVAKDDVAGIGDKVVVHGTEAQVEVGNDAVLEAVDANEDGTQSINVLRVQVEPDLAVAVEGAAAINKDVLAAELEEGGDVLVDELERVGLPVVGVVGEQDGSLDVWTVSPKFSN